ncbi:hypothetical protein CVT24_010237 [Panaeolus cyanescens]|uniref:Uncharacterized protein n=1 Tax=Panaeolus cyanescens TaxID=181874 RepID=A0A409WMS6_9AGAR|nr:hypothetical protein CVT24_010237 [Panaeolus cyanescens]
MDGQAFASADDTPADPLPFHTPRMEIVMRENSSTSVFSMFEQQFAVRMGSAIDFPPPPRVSRMETVMREDSTGTIFSMDVQDVRVISDSPVKSGNLGPFTANVGMDVDLEHGFETYPARSSQLHTLQHLSETSAMEAVPRTGSMQSVLSMGEYISSTRNFEGGVDMEWMDIVPQSNSIASIVSMNFKDNQALNSRTDTPFVFADQVPATPSRYAFSMGQHATVTGVGDVGDVEMIRDIEMWDVGDVEMIRGMEIVGKADSLMSVVSMTIPRSHFAMEAVPKTESAGNIRTMLADGDETESLAVKSNQFLPRTSSILGVTFEGRIKSPTDIIPLLRQSKQFDDLLVSLSRESSYATVQMSVDGSEYGEVAPASPQGHTFYVDFTGAGADHTQNRNTGPRGTRFGIPGYVDVSDDDDPVPSDPTPSHPAQGPSMKSMNASVVSHASNSESTIINPLADKMYRALANNPEFLRTNVFAEAMRVLLTVSPAWATNNETATKSSIPATRSRRSNEIENEDPGNEADTEEEEEEEEKPKVKNNARKSRPAVNKRISRLMRAHVCNLLKRQPNQGGVIQPIFSVPVARAMAFKRTKERGPSPADFVLSLDHKGLPKNSIESKACKEWNIAATDIFLTSFLEAHPDERSHRDLITKSFREHIDYLEKQYVQYNTQNGPDETALRNNRRETRRINKYHRRLDTLVPNPKIPKMKQLRDVTAQHLDWRCCSGDESSEDEAGNKILVITHLEWRSRYLQTYMRTLDLVHIASRFPDGVNPTPGNFPCNRYDPEELNPPQARRPEQRHNSAVPGLPINFYDAGWLAKQTPGERALLRMLEPEDLTLPEDIVKKAQSVADVRGKASRPLPAQHGL